MTRAALLLLALLAASCSDEGAATGDPPPAVADGTEVETPVRPADGAVFVKSCLAVYNWERPLCACAERRARERLSAAGYAFLLAAMRDDQATTERLRGEMSMEEAMAAGTFFANAPAACAPGLQGADG